MKRFYENVTVDKAEAGYAIRLDKRPIKTPAKAPVFLPTEALAEAIADEWRSQKDKVEPAAMPLMQAAATAIDRVMTQRQKVIDDIVAYGGTDLICYRATYPASLISKQSDAWDPLIDWIKSRHGAHLKTTSSIAHITQDERQLEKLAAIVDAQEDMTLAPLYNITALCGSLVIGLAVLDGHLSADEAFDVSELDETHAIENWGADDEALIRRKNNKESLMASTRFLKLSGILV
ncbi:MAG: ATP12 family protein [Sneathiella sp.]|uniref:ATP12 family chaperone protein n=1 Tax=Sneathiella sp. TaxID=1964365 RepID=UPI0030038EA8